MFDHLNGATRAGHDLRADAGRAGAAMFAQMRDLMIEFLIGDSA